MSFKQEKYERVFEKKGNNDGKKKLKNGGIAKNMSMADEFAC